MQTECEPVWHGEGYQYGSLEDGQGSDLSSDSSSKSLPESSGIYLITSSAISSGLSSNSLNFPKNGLEWPYSLWHNCA